jgi:hypothetical protein
LLDQPAGAPEIVEAVALIARCILRPAAVSVVAAPSRD